MNSFLSLSLLALLGCAKESQSALQRITGNSEDVKTQTSTTETVTNEINDHIRRISFANDGDKDFTVEFMENDPIEISLSEKKDIVLHEGNKIGEYFCIDEDCFEKEITLNLDLPEVRKETSSSSGPGNSYKKYDVIQAFKKQVFFRTSRMEDFEAYITMDDERVKYADLTKEVISFNYNFTKFQNERITASKYYQDVSDYSTVIWLYSENSQYKMRIKIPDTFSNWEDEDEETILADYKVQDDQLAVFLYGDPKKDSAQSFKTLAYHLDFPQMFKGEIDDHINIFWPEKKDYL